MNKVEETWDSRLRSLSKHLEEARQKLEFCQDDYFKLEYRLAIYSCEVAVSTILDDITTRLQGGE